eukprot:TRINITY_DN26769_c0_g1_i2.p1 TRINITY_DN26769_c0_g1~~TRINITY_DN26769_c0_g1_i2.p1  ORF type:complete len:374 (+),score=89.04 TRINITY_DN26769_c0_g1_i2:285-1406(+)
MNDGNNYTQAALSKYTTEARWANATWYRLETWGFNTIAAWSYSRARDFPSSPWIHDLGFEHSSSLVQDWWGSGFLNDIDQRASQFFTPEVVNDSTLIGVNLANEMTWGSHVDKWPVLPREKDVILFRYLGFNGSSPGFGRAVEFLKNRYSTIQELNEAWLIRATSFESITERVPFLIPSKARAHDADDFMVMAAKQFFEASRDAVRRYDQNHLILGVRYSFWEKPGRVVALEGGYTDVSTFNGYWWFPGYDIRKQVEEIHSLSGKPVLITEFGFKAMENNSSDHNDHGSAGMPVISQQQRATLLREWLVSLLSCKAAVGYHWWKWVDDAGDLPKSHEVGNFGLVDIADNTYTGVVDTFTEANRNAMQWHEKSF